MEGMNTIAIVTQDASPLLGAIHNDSKRQPLILKGDAALSWMIPGLNENEIMDLTYFHILIISYQHTGLLMEFIATR